MERGDPHIRLKLNIAQPIELSEFVGAFTAIASEYDRFVRTEKPDADPNATLYVKEVRAGCIEAELIPWVIGAAAGLVALAGSANTIAAFVERYGGYLGLYKTKGGRHANATAAQLKDFGDQVAAVADVEGSSLEVAAIEVVDGEKITRAAFKFDTSEAREIRDNIDRHRRDMERKTDVQHPRVVMVFTRSDVGDSKIGKHSGERVRIDSIAPKKKLPLIYASDLAEKTIKHEIREAEDNIYKKGFVVDVNVEVRADGKPIGYRVTDVHQVIDVDDEEDD
jgi:hypothetical protein